MTIRCALGRFQDDRPDVEQVKRDGWREQSILVVSATDTRLNWVEREQVRQLGEKLYGTRGSA